MNDRDTRDTDPSLYRHVVIQLEDCPRETLMTLKKRLQQIGLNLEQDGLIHGFDYAVNEERIEL